ncbi:MAG: hypothetical protein KIT77_26205 [Caldilinea sp.]|nr:hypothetical protein [Caldilinea sp.]MCB0152387.1 hypothetical protein [Caldilineaceae bacterium]MCW5844773.1 hypothetical protein [Caldilinea sp.]
MSDCTPGEQCSRNRAGIRSKLLSMLPKPLAGAPAWGRDEYAGRARLGGSAGK